MRWRRRRSEAPVCYLVYTREGPEADEPLAAVVASEPEAVAFESLAHRRYPGLGICWEEVAWHQVDGAHREPREVHVVATGAENNTVGIGVFDDVAAADRMVSEGMARGHDLHRRTVRMAEWLSEDYPLDD